MHAKWKKGRKNLVLDDFTSCLKLLAVLLVQEKPNTGSVSSTSSQNQLQKILQFTGSPILRLYENMQEDSPSLEKTRFQFNRLFSRLDALAEICNIHLQEGWLSLDTPLGSIKVSPNGDALIDDQQRWTTVYEPAAMKDVTAKHAPDLFQMLLSAISRDDSRISPDHQKLQQQRIAVLLHTLAYFSFQISSDHAWQSILIYWHEVQSYFGHCSYLLFVYPGNIHNRSQKTCSPQKDEGLFVRQHKGSRAAINSGRILGFRTSLRDVDSHQKFLVASYTNSLQRHLNQAIKEGTLIVNLLDDFHNILTIRLPTQLKLSVATHMTSSLLDMHPKVKAIPVPTCREKRHSNVELKTGDGGGIVIINELFSQYWPSTLSKTYMEISNHHIDTASKDIQQQLKEMTWSCFIHLNVYSGLSHDELCTLKTTEQSLKSMENYKSAINRSLNCCPELRQYLDKFGTGQNESSPLLSFIPEQVPFHVFLNLQEDVLKIYHFILKRIYKETFGSDLPKKPKPFRISLVITAVFLLWTKLVRHKVLSIIAGKAAEVLLSTFKKVPQETTARGQPKGDAKFYLKTFDMTVDTKACPLGYTFAKLEPQTIPDQDLVCDYAECSENSITDAVRFNCFHTFHKTCLDKTGQE
ncbi:hypothetical protein P5673_032931, partial [Acropora cervicornis]